MGAYGGRKARPFQAIFHGPSCNYSTSYRCEINVTLCWCSSHADSLHFIKSYDFEAFICFTSFVAGFVDVLPGRTSWRWWPQQAPCTRQAP